MSKHYSRRKVLKGLAATSLILPLGAMGAVGAKATPKQTTSQGKIPYSQQPVHYVFASDPRAALPQFRVMPG